MSGDAKSVPAKRSSVVEGVPPVGALSISRVDIHWSSHAAVRIGSQTVVEHVL